MSFADDEYAGSLEQRQPLDLGVFSPKARKPVTFDFPEAMSEVRAGKKVTKLEWAEKGEAECHVLLREGRLQIFRNGRFSDWVISDGDVAGEDYVDA